MTITDVEYKLHNALDAYISALKAIPFYDESELSAIQDNQHVAECLENAEKAIDYVENGRSYEALAMVYLSRREGIIELYKATKAIAEELAAKTLIQRLETVAGTEGTGQEHAKKALKHARPWQGLAKDESRMRKVIGPVRQAGKELRREDYALNEFMWALKFDEARVSNPSAEHGGILKGYVKQLDESIDDQHERLGNPAVEYSHTNHARRDKDRPSNNLDGKSVAEWFNRKHPYISASELLVPSNVIPAIVTEKCDVEDVDQFLTKNSIAFRIVNWIVENANPAIFPTGIRILWKYTNESWEEEEYGPLEIMHVEQNDDFVPLWRETSPLHNDWKVFESKLRKTFPHLQKYLGTTL